MLAATGSKHGKSVFFYVTFVKRLFFEMASTIYERVIFTLIFKGVSPSSIIKLCENKRSFLSHP